MGRKKRADKGAVPRIQTSTKTGGTSVGVRTVVFAFCPTCGRTIPEKRAIKAGRVTVDHINYFAAIDWDPNKEFGTSYDAIGHAPVQNWHYISPEDAPGLFNSIKQRMLQGLYEWKMKGWISQAEIDIGLAGGSIDDNLDGDIDEHFNGRG